MKRHWNVLRTTLILLMAVTSSAVAEDAVAPTMQSPEDLWRGVDIHKTPLDIEILSTRVEDGIRIETLTFVGEIIGDRPVRVYAFRAVPIGPSNVPGILHIHGGGQTCSMAWVMYWAKRGYACVSHDFCGRWQGRTSFTDWGPLPQGNMESAQGGYQVHPTPRESSWFHWTLVARRALSVLAEVKAVDDDRLGIFGISVGGTLCWMVAGTDARVKAAVPIYGCGYNIDERKTVWGFPPLTSDQQLFQQVVSAEAHASFVRCPTLFLSATNDHHGWMDDSFDALKLVKGETRQAFTPRFIHHVAWEQGQDLPRWMDTHLKGKEPFPASPVLNVTLGTDGVPRGRVEVDANDVESVSIYYSLGDHPPPNRYWRHASKDDQQQLAEAKLEFMDPSVPLVAFANARYRSGVSLSSPLVHVIPTDLGNVHATLKWSADIDHTLTAREHWYYPVADTDPMGERSFFAAATVGEEDAIAMNRAIFGDMVNVRLSTHAISDPQFVGPKGAKLAFDYRGAFDGDKIHVRLHQQEWTPLGCVYVVQLPAPRSLDEWKTIPIKLDQFHNAAGESPKDWSVAGRFELEGTARQSESPTLRRLRWLVADGSEEAK